jgi:hypothetical protein
MYIAFRIAELKDRKYILSSVVAAWILIVPIVIIVSDIIPYANGGDDKYYYYLAGIPLKNIYEIFNLTRFVGMLEQPGYAILLSVIQIIIGHDLIIYKLLNMFFLIILALIWYNIGLNLESNIFARKIFVLILFLTPLWYYVLILLKDMTITLLQSIFLLGAIEYWNKPKPKAIILMLMSNFVLLLFRTPLLIQNASVLVTGLMLKTILSKERGHSYVPIIITMIILIFIVPIVTDQSIMMNFGIYTESRVLGSKAMLEKGALYRDVSEINKTMFPILYLLTETSGLSWKVWENIDSVWLRGVLALPWIFILVPFIFIGLKKILSTYNTNESAGNKIDVYRKRIIFSTPWLLVMLFIITSIIVSWTVGDSTRWRMPDLPMIASIIAVGMLTNEKKYIINIVLWWIGCMSVIFTLYYI